MLKKKKKFAQLHLEKKTKQEKQKHNFWSFSRVYKGRGRNSYFHDSHSQLDYGGGIALTGIYLNGAASLSLEYHNPIVLSICPPLPPLPSFSLSLPLNLTPRSFH